MAVYISCGWFGITCFIPPRDSIALAHLCRRNSTILFSFCVSFVFSSVLINSEVRLTWGVATLDCDGVEKPAPFQTHLGAGLWRWRMQARANVEKRWEGGMALWRQGTSGFQEFSTWICHYPSVPVSCLETGLCAAEPRDINLQP